MEEQQELNTEEIVRAEVPDTGKTMDELRREEAEEPKEVLTEVTSLAQEEAKTGQKVELPNEQDLMARASMSHIQDMQIYQRLFAKLSSKGKTRVSVAVLQLPTSQIPVTLKTEEEKMAFAYGQRALSSRFLVTQFYINEEIKKRELAKKDTEVSNLLNDLDKNNQTENKGETNEQPTE